MFLVLLFLLNIASAGETYSLDFTKTNSYVVGLKEGDRVEFNLKDSLNTVLIKEIKLDGVNIAIFTNIEDEDASLKVPLYSKLTKVKYVKLDLEKDGEPDVFVMYKGSNSTAVSLLFQLPVAPDKNLEVFPESQFGQSSPLKNLFYLFLVLISIFVLLFFMFRKKSKETTKAIGKQSQNKAE